MMLVQKQAVTLSKPFVTESGFVLKQAQVAYEDYGVPDGPVVLFAHGGLSDPHAAGRYSDQDLQPGYWDHIIGPGKVLDTNRIRVLSANALGSMFGTTGPLSINPDTNQRYGPDFPKITMIDMVRFHKAFLEELGVTRLALMAGVSMGALHTLQMGALYPNFVGGLFAVAAAGRMTPGGMAMHHYMTHALRSDPEFNGGRYQDGQCKLCLHLIHNIMKIYYTHERIIRHSCWDTVAEGPHAQDHRSENCRLFVTGEGKWLGERDANSYITVLDAINTFDLGRDAADYERGVQRITCPVYLLSTNTDSEFPPFFAEEVANILNRRQPGQAQTAVMDSDWGHLACVKEETQIAQHLQNFLQRLDLSY